MDSIFSAAAIGSLITSLTPLLTGLVGVYLILKAYKVVVGVLRGDEGEGSFELRYDEMEAREWNSLIDQGWTQTELEIGVRQSFDDGYESQSFCDDAKGKNGRW